MTLFSETSSDCCTLLLYDRSLVCNCLGRADITNELLDWPLLAGSTLLGCQSTVVRELILNCCVVTGSVYDRSRIVSGSSRGIIIINRCDPFNAAVSGSAMCSAVDGAPVIPPGSEALDLD